MSNKSEVIQALTQFIERKREDTKSLICTVDSYDAVSRTCYCIPIDDYADIQGVKICPHDGATGILYTPKEGSIVMVSFMSDKSAYISMFSEIENIALGGVSYGGIPKVNALLTKLNALENKLNAVLTAIGTTWVVAGGDGGAALKALFVPPLTTPVVNTTLASIENTVITHGDGTA